MKIQKILLYVALGVLITLVLSAGFFLGRISIKKPTVYNTPPIRIQYRRPLVLEPIKGQVVSPHIIRSFPLPTLNSTLMKVNDSLNMVITGLKNGKKDTVYISDNFIKFYPKYPKLLSLSVTRDSLSLTLMEPSAKVYTSVFNIDLLNNQYQYQFPELKSKPHKLNLPKPVDKHSLVLGLSVVYQDSVTPRAYIDYRYTLKPFQIRITTLGTITSKPNISTELGIGLKLF